MIEPPILYQSNHLLIIDKPSGVPCHAGKRSERSVEDFFPRWRRGDDGPWLAHRLDADTSGCLVIARRKTALLEIQSAFAERRVQKTYWAIVAGTPEHDSGTIDAPLAKRNERSGWRMVINPKGQQARTEWQVLARRDNATLVELKPETGRTHQLRVHCASIGHPILGDQLYGASSGVLCLLAHRIAIPFRGVVVTGVAPLSEPCRRTWYGSQGIDELPAE